MDAFDFKEEKPQAARQGSSVSPGLVWNILTGIILAVTACVALVYLSILINPYSTLNPFQPPTEVVPIQPPTITPTLRNELPPTWTPGPTLEPSATPLPRPTSTPFPTQTPISIAPVDTPTAGPTPVFSFVLQAGSPQAIPNIYYPDAGCNWMGVAGQATALNGGPAAGLIVQVGGTLEGKLFETRISLTGVSPQIGPGGYEIQLADKAIASNNSMWIQLVDVGNMPFSDQIFFDTFADCEKNLIIINFKQIK